MTPPLVLKRHTEYFKYGRPIAAGMIARLGTLAPSVNVTESANCPGLLCILLIAGKTFSAKRAPRTSATCRQPALAGGC
jgi:hypothetical protein